MHNLPPQKNCQVSNVIVDSDGIFSFFPSWFDDNEFREFSAIFDIVYSFSVLRHQHLPMPASSVHGISVICVYHH